MPAADQHLLPGDGDNTAAIALGSNLPGLSGSREGNLTAALQAIDEIGTVFAVSCFHDTAPVGPTPDQPRFLNAAALVKTSLSPPDLLDALLRIERRLGRDRSSNVLKGPRSLDLDLLLYNSEVLNTDRLILPHPELHLRRFVLEPLAEIAPALVHPTIGLTVRQLLDSLNDGIAQPLTGAW